ncbi:MULTISPECIES: TolC family outer membrane protein [unclassified Devosia]|uniref:TolC family outer membrane protein n=1 Tax=unclassified Devosia TaxID=196773 RepID=UPI000FD95126|nr:MULTISPECIES: TolC family outer membrane protein [unclassified Devosia]
MSIRVKLTASALAIALAMGGTAAQAQSITQALTAAYSYAPDLQAAVLDAKSRAENIVQAKSRKLPTIGASVNGTYNWSIAGGQFQDSTSLNAGLSYSQTLFDNFQTEAQIEAARAGAEAAEYQIRNTEQNVLLNVVQAYMSVLSDRQLVGLRQENVNFYNTQLSSARDRLEVGEGTRIDVAQANARLAQGQAAYQAAVNSLEVSEATFQRYVGQAPRDLQSSHSFARLIPNSLQSAIAEAESGHPAILTAKAAIRAAQAGSDAAQGAFGPTIDVTGSIGASDGTSRQGTPQAVSGQMRLNISVPIYAGGALGSGVRQANLDQIRSEVDAMSIYDQIREAVISAWAGIQNADAQIQAAQSAVSAGQEVVNGVIQERDLGTRTTLDVLNAQAELISAREGLINASSSKVIATFSLLASIGRLTAGDLGLPVQTKTAVNYTQEVEDVWQELRVVKDE